MIRLPLLLLFSATVSAGTVVYRTETPDGSIEFSDEPKRGAEKITLPDLPVYEAPKPRSAAAPKEVKEKEAAPASDYQRIAVVTPQADATLFRTDQGIPVSVALAPNLKSDHLVTISVNGQLMAKGRGTSFTLSEVYRGTHTVTAAVTDSRGKVVISSAPVIFHVRQHSVLHPKP